MRVPYEEMKSVMEERLVKLGVERALAARCAANLTNASLDGVSSHGLNRFTRLAEMIRKGVVKPENRAECVAAAGALEVWDGKLGLGNINAEDCMGRAVELAGANGIGCVALRHTNHWMRGGAYGIQAAKAGCIGICWTTTMPNMPAWGAKSKCIGNNPLIFCVPYRGSYVLMDAAMAQFSFGAVDSAILAGKKLSVPGGYNANGELTDNPEELAESGRFLPIGYWKGSGLSVLLDMIASGLSGGMPVCEIGRQGTAATDEYNLNQIFIAVKVHDQPGIDQRVDEIIESVTSAEPAEGVEEIRYPSQRAKRIHDENLQYGIPVNEGIWNQVLSV